MDQNEEDQIRTERNTQSAHRARSPRSRSAALREPGKQPAENTEREKTRTARSARAPRSAAERGNAVKREVHEERTKVRETMSSHPQAASEEEGSRGAEKKKRSKAPVYAAAVAAAVLVIGGTVFAVRKLGTGSAEKLLHPATESEETLSEDAIRIPAVLDLGALVASGMTEESSGDSSGAGQSQSGTGADPSILSVRGLTPDEIREKVSALYSWDMKIHNGQAEVGATVKPTVDAAETTEAATLGDAEHPDSSPQEGLSGDTAQQEITVSDEIAVPDLVLLKLDELLQKLEEDNRTYSGNTAEHADQGTKAADGSSETSAEQALVYTLRLDGADDAAAEVSEEAAQMWNRLPKGGSIGSYDRATDQFVMEGASAGFEVDQEALETAILEALSGRAFDSVIEVPGQEISAEEATAASEYRIIASYTTKTTNNKTRNRNIELACEAINGTVLAPGEEFSFNNVVGQRTAEKGYGAAAAYNEGEVVQEIGGGICQVSSTLYNAVLRAGLKTTKRQSHTFEPSYVTPGMDATVSWGGPDYRFANLAANPEYANEGSYAIGIRAHYENREVTISIYGRPVLKDGYSFELKSTKVKDIPVVRKLIEPNSGKTPTKGSSGSQWTTNLVVKQNGTVVSDAFDHNTYYSGHIEYYTEQPVTAAPAESSEAVTETETAESTQAPAETPSQKPQYETGIYGGPGIGLDNQGVRETTAEVGPGVAQTQAQTTAAPEPAALKQTEAPAPVPAPEEAGPGIPVSGSPA